MLIGVLSVTCSKLNCWNFLSKFPLQSSPSLEKDPGWSSFIHLFLSQSTFNPSVKTSPLNFFKILNLTTLNHLHCCQTLSSHQHLFLGQCFAPTLSLSLYSTSSVFHFPPTVKILFKNIIKWPGSDHVTPLLKNSHSSLDNFKHTRYYLI